MKHIFGFSVFLLFALQSTVLGQQNNSGLFAGSSTRVRVVDGVTYNPAAIPSAYQISGTAITVEGWVFPTSLLANASGQTILKRPTVLGSNDLTDAYALSITYVNGFPQAAFSISDGSPGSVVLDPDTLRRFQWTHLAGTYDGTNLRLYSNGVLKAQTPASISMTGTAIGLYMGRTGSDGFTGLLDDIRLWNTTRSGAEISSSKDIVLTGSEPGLAGYWKLDTTVVSPSSLLVIPDDSPNKNDLSNLGITFSSYNAINAFGSPTALITPSSFDLGVGRTQGDIVTIPITITNSGLGPLFGSFTSASQGVAASSGSYSVPPMSSFSGNITIRILEAGTWSGTIVFDGNIAAPVSIPFTVQAYPLPFIDANNVFMWLSNKGGFARNGVTSAAGFEWPKGTGKTAVYASGIWIAATVGGATRTAVSEYASEFAAGPIVGGVPANPTDRRYRVYKITQGDNASNPDYAEWPIDLGAPANPDSTPAIFGNQTLFSVYNDMTAHSKFLTAPLGAEVQQTTFAFDQSGALGNTVFLRFKIVNRSSDVWQNTYVALWSDPDLGNPQDDLIGIDTMRTLGFTFNGNANDPTSGLILGYGATPPAVGYDILKGAFFTKEIQAFARYTASQPFPDRDPQTGQPQQAYYFMQGLRADGSPFINPTTSMPTTFPVSGDPVTGTGWVDSSPGDRRFLFSTGPFDLEPGQSKEMIAAIIVAQGTDHLNSITALRAASDQIQGLFDGGQIFGGGVESVVSTSVAENDTTTLDDLANSGAQFDLVGGTGGATVEAASYIEAPPGASSITTPAVAGVGNYIEVQVQGNVQWPVEMRIYYTANDLSQAGVTEGDLEGIYYWNGTSSQWILYSNSGADDQGRGPSTTGVNTTNVTINSINYEGFVYASAYHLTPIIIGARVHQTPPIGTMFTDAISFLASLPANAFTPPARVRRDVLIAVLQLSQGFYERGKPRLASALLSYGVLHIGLGRHSWIKDPSARAQFAGMVQDLIDALGQPANQAAVQNELQMFDEANLVPQELTLSDAYPNPFNPQTSLQFTVPEDGRTSVRVFNMLGEEVQVLFNEGAKAGQRYTVEFNGAKLASGMYIVRLEYAGEQIARRILLTK